MKLFFVAFTFLCFTVSCKNEKPAGEFEVAGEIANVPDQKIYLEELHFNATDPEVLDTGEIKNGKFAVSAIGREEGMYRLRFEKNEGGYLFINDAAEINFKADFKKAELNDPDFQTPANRKFKNFLMAVDEQRRGLDAIGKDAEAINATGGTDSLLNARLTAMTAKETEFKKFILKTIDTISDPVVAMFAVGYTKGIDSVQLDKSVNALETRFKGHSGIATVVAQYKTLLAKENVPPPAASPLEGSAAPDFTMNDVNGKPVKLSSFRGKYVLVDFWASWCGPCRGENPKVVANFNKFKDKNFTILGVSLDEDRNAWLGAIQKDGLAWTNISDLKGWSSLAVPLYGINGIPYNVLLDPQGKIVAAELRGPALGIKLAEVLK